MKIREATEKDFARIWLIFREIVAAGDTYAYARDTTKEQALKIWIEVPRKTFVLEEAGNILGTYYIKTNQQGPGDHVCNCGYMVSSAARGCGLATAMCEHSQDIAKKLGYQAMQFILSPQAMTAQSDFGIRLALRRSAACRRRLIIRPWAMSMR